MVQTIELLYWYGPGYTGNGTPALRVAQENNKPGKRSLMKLLQALALMILVAFCACSTSSSSSESPASGVSPQSTPSRPTEAIDSSDPTCCDPYSNADIKKAWKSFTEDGRYRLAHRSLESQAYAFTWGDLGYVYESNHHHLAAIVEDTSRTDAVRYGVVMFSAPAGENGTYRTYWLLRDRDLSQAFFFKASGYLEVHIVSSNGSTEICNIRWNARLKEYNCRGT